MSYEFMKKINLGVLGLFFLNLFIQNVNAESYVPEPLQGLTDNLGFGTSSFLSSRISNLFLIAFIVLTVFAVGYLAFSAFKFIQSRGDSSKQEEARKGVESILLGFVVTFVGLSGVVIVFVLFGAGFPPIATYQSCLSAPDSVGCESCEAEQGGLPEFFETAKFSSTNPISTFQVASAATVIENGNGNREFSLGARGTITNYQMMCTFCEYEYFYASNNDNNFQSPAQVENYCQ
jgi:hypothetical protein